MSTPTEYDDNPQKAKELEKPPTLYEKFTSMPGYNSIADLLEDTSRAKESLIGVFKNRAVSSFLQCEDEFF